MRAQDSNDGFYVTFSAWKIWLYAILCWAIASIFLLPIVLFIIDLFSDKRDFTSNFVIVLFGPIFLLIAATGFMFLAKRNKPLGTLTRNGFSGLKNFKKQSFTWTPNTIVYNGPKGASLILANPDPVQSRMSKLWGGPKAAAVVHSSLAKQSRQEVLDAINRLSPYPVKQTTLLDASFKH